MHTYAAFVVDWWRFMHPLVVKVANNSQITKTLNTIPLVIVKAYEIDAFPLMEPQVLCFE